MMVFRRRVRFAAFLWGAALAVGGRCAVATAQQIPMWPPEQANRAMETARAQKQLVLVYVSSDTCPWCRNFERTHLADPAFIAWTNALFQVVHANADRPQHAAWLKRAGLDDIPDRPRYYVLDASGKRIAASKYSAQFAPLKGVQLFDQVKGRRFDFDVGRLSATAREIEALRQRAPTVEKRLSYGALEAVLWHWLGNPTQALAAFGPDAAPALLRGPQPASDEALAAWDEIRLWYTGFWSSWAEANFPAALQVAEQGYNTRKNPVYARWAAFLSDQNGQPDRATRWGELYLSQTKLPANHPFRRLVADWKRRGGGTGRR